MWLEVSGKMIGVIVSVIAALVAVVFAFQAWKRFTVSGCIATLIESSETLGRSPTGQSKRAHDSLVKMHRRALPALRKRNEQLIVEHVAYSEALKAGPSWNPYENYQQKSDAEKHYRYVIEIKQARIVDVIEAIERSSTR